MNQWLTIDMHVQMLKSRFTIHKGIFESNLKIAIATSETRNNMNSDIRIVRMTEAQSRKVVCKNDVVKF
jgi:hypothetical protein